MSPFYHNSGEIALKPKKIGNCDQICLTILDIGSIFLQCIIKKYNLVLWIRIVTEKTDPIRIRVA